MGQLCGEFIAAFISSSSTPVLPSHPTMLAHWLIAALFVGHATAGENHGSALSANGNNNNYLDTGDYLLSVNGWYLLIQQTNGNLEMFTCEGISHWASGWIDDYEGAIALNSTQTKIEHNGNVVQYYQGEAVWQTGNDIIGPGIEVIAELRDDGDFSVRWIYAYLNHTFDRSIYSSGSSSDASYDCSDASSGSSSDHDWVAAFLAQI